MWGACSVVAVVLTASAAPAPRLHARVEVEVPEGAPSDALRVRVVLRATPPAHGAVLRLGWSSSPDAARPALEAAVTRGARLAEDGSAWRAEPDARGALELAWRWEGRPAEWLEVVPRLDWQTGSKSTRARVDVEAGVSAPAQRWRAPGRCAGAAGGAARPKGGATEGAGAAAAVTCRLDGAWSFELLESLPVRSSARGRRAEVDLSRGDAAEVAALADAALTALEGALGPAPWPRVVVVDAPRAAQGGLSLPGLVALAPALLEGTDATGREQRALALAHELAHQWFGAAAVFAPGEPESLVEGLAQHLAARVLRKLPGQAGAPAPMELYRRTWAAFRAGGGQDAAADLPLGAYAPAARAALAYAKVPAALAGAEALLGSARFEALLRRLLQTGRQGELCAGCFARALEAVGPKGAEAAAGLERALRARTGDEALGFSSADAGR